MKRYLQCAEQQESASNFSKYCACQEKWLSWSILFTHETLFTMRGGTSVIVQTHQILRLPRKMNLMIDPCHTWNAIYNARSNTCHCPNSPNTAPATKNESHAWSLSHMKRYLQCAEEQVSLSKLTKYCACHEKWISWLIFVTHERLFTMRRATSVIVQTHQILRLPRKMNLMIDPCHAWKAIYNARSNKCHCPNSPNTAPATKNESHDWSLSHMKRYLQCAEQQVSLSKLTKYCACHAKWLSKILQKFLKNSWNVISNAGPIREWSENDPSWIRPWNRHPQPASQPRLLFTPTTSILYWKIQHFALRLSFQISPNTAPATKSDTSTSPNTAPATKNESHDWSLSHMKRYLQCAEQQVSLSKLTKYCACHEKWISWLILVTHERLFTMRRATSVIVQTHQILRLPRKMNLMIDPCHTWNAIYNARSNKCHCPNSPNTAPATQNDSPKFCKNFSKTAETSFPMRGRSENDPSWIRPWNRHPQPASQPRLLFRTTTSILYWKIQHFALRLSFQISPNTAPAKKSDTSTSPNTAPATQNDCHNWSSSHVKRYFQCAEQPVSPWNISEYCACHAKWLSNISKKFLENSWNVISNAGPIRAWSENDPSWIRAGSELKTVIRNPPRNRGYFSGPPRAFCIEKYNISRSGYHSKFHRILRLPRKVTLQLHRILRLPRKVTLERHQIVHLPRKVTLERHQIVHLPRKVTLELHQTVHLPRKVTLRYSTLL